MLSKKKYNKILQVSILAGVYDRNQSIRALQFPAHIENALIEAKVNTVGKFYRIKKRQLMKINRIGSKNARYLMSVKKTIKLLKYLDPEQNRGVETLISVSKKDPIEILGLPTRVENALKKGRMKSVIEFYNFPENKLTKLKNMGPKTKRFLLDAIKPKINFVDLDQQPPKLGLGQPKNYETSSELLLEKLFEKMKTVRDAEVIQRRYGLFTGESETLEEIGKTFGVTRERVRQIQNRALKRLRHPSNQFKTPVSEVINELILKKDGVISDAEADQLIPKLFSKKYFDGSSFLDLLADCGWIQTSRLAEGDVSFYAPKINVFDLNKVSEKIYQLLKNTKELVELSELAKTIPDSLELFGSKKIELVTKLCKIDPRVDERTKNKFTLFSNHSRTLIWVNLMKEVLGKQNVPLHYTEIAHDVNDLLVSADHELDPRRAHSILIENANFAHSGLRGMFGLTEWGLRKESTVDLAKEFIQNAGFPVHWKQIYDYISRYKDSPLINIKSILDSSGKFERVGNGFYDVKKN